MTAWRRGPCGGRLLDILKMLWVIQAMNIAGRRWHTPSAAQRSSLMPNHVNLLRAFLAAALSRKAPSMEELAGFDRKGGL